MATEIVLAPDAEKRREALKWFIQFAEARPCIRICMHSVIFYKPRDVHFPAQYLRELRNYNCLLSIMAGLNFAAVSRLKSLWKVCVCVYARARVRSAAVSQTRKLNEPAEPEHEGHAELSGAQQPLHAHQQLQSMSAHDVAVRSILLTVCRRCTGKSSRLFREISRACRTWASISRTSRS